MAYLYEDPCVLIGGAARSGTTLVGEILASHPKAAMLLEERLTNVVLAVERLSSIRTLADESDRTKLYGGPRSFLPSPLWDDEAKIERLGALGTYIKRFQQLFKTTFEVTAGKNAVTIVGSKLPISEDWENVDLLRSRLSDLRIILIIRNPIDVISSSMVRAKNASAGLDEWLIKTADAAYAQWLVAMKTMNSVLNAAPSESVLLLKYEDLCDFPEREERRIYDFASLVKGGSGILSRPRRDGRSILSQKDLDFLRDELGDVDKEWPKLKAQEALYRYARIVRHLPIGQASLENGSHDWILASGFGDIEHWGRWTDGPVATLRFRCSELRSAARLGLDVAMARVPPGKTGAPLAVRVNSGSPRVALARPGERLDIGLSKEDIAKESLVVEISVLEPKPLNEAPVHDPRQLGIALTGLSLCPISEGHFCQLC